MFRLSNRVAVPLDCTSYRERADFSGRAEFSGVLNQETLKSRRGILKSSECEFCANCTAAGYLTAKFREGTEILQILAQGTIDSTERTPCKCGKFGAGHFMCCC